MSDLSEPSANMLTIVSNTECTVTRLLPLLSLLETPEQPDRITQLLETLHLILDMQQQQAIVLKTIADRLDRLSRR